MHIVAEISVTKKNVLSTGFEPAIFPLRRGRLTTWPRKPALFFYGPVVTRSRRRSTTRCACILVQGLLGVRCVVTVMGGV